MARNWWGKLFAGKPPPRKLCYIKFEIASPQALDRLTAVVDALRAEKVQQSGRSDEEWRAFFTHEELATFWEPDEQEQKLWNDYWFSTPLPKRHSADMPTPPWHFGSMLEAILDEGDYDLGGVRRVDDRTATLEFDPHGYPYGGTGSLRALIRAFGHHVIGADDGTGYAEGELKSPPWTPGMRADA